MTQPQDMQELIRQAAEVQAALQQAQMELLQTEVTGFERDKKLVRTAHGLIEYDFLILSGGIRNDYEAWFGNDQKAIDYTRKHFPNAYIPNQEMLALKSKVKNFKGGTLVMTLPPPPHRCPPSPYERACLIAWHIKKHKIPGKILILGSASARLLLDAARRDLRDPDP